MVPDSLSGSYIVTPTSLSPIEFYLFLFSFFLLELHDNPRILHTSPSICFFFIFSSCSFSCDFFIWINYFNFIIFFSSLKFDQLSFNCYFINIDDFFNDFTLLNFLFLSNLIFIFLICFFSLTIYFNWLIFLSFKINLIVVFFNWDNF